MFMSLWAEDVWILLRYEEDQFVLVGGSKKGGLLFWEEQPRERLATPDRIVIQ
jgi:hypothetical protein